jgi:hypothetical protein
VATAAVRPTLMLPETTTTLAPPPQPPVTSPTEPPAASQPPPAPIPAPEPPAAIQGVSEAIQAAFSPYGQAAVDTALRVARCESQMDPNALSDSGTYAGLFQIGNFWAEDFLNQTGSPYYDGRFDPYANARFAAWLAYEAPGGGWQHWACA